jgi:anti-sigma-K factor RskA
MSGHEQFADDLALYALDALQGQERANLEQHLATCAACKRELEQLRGDTALLALSTLGPKPPQRARQRLLDAVAKEAPMTSRARLQEVPSNEVRTRSWWPWLGWAATAAVVLFAVSLGKENYELKRDLRMASSMLSQRTQDLEQARSLANSLTDPDSQHFTLVALKAPPQPQGKAIYLRKRSSLIFMANNMPSLPSQKAYELWLIPMEGAPIPAGTFKPDAHGSATVINPPLPRGMHAKAFAITVENEAGAATPTMPIVMMGTGE